MKTMKYREDIMIVPTAPFHFSGTMHKPSHFPSSDNAFEDDKYWQSMRFDNHLLGFSMTNKGSIDNPKVLLSIFSNRKLSSDQLTKIKDEIEYRFDMRMNISSFINDVGNDTVLAPILKRWRGMRVSNGNSLYEFLIITTVLQNATVRRSVQMLENLFSKYGSKISFDGKKLSAFWLAEAIDSASEEELRGLKLGYRAKTFKRQAESFVSGVLDEDVMRAYSTDELKRSLLQIYGIGPASVWYLLFEVFKKYDAFEYISPWEQKIYSHILFKKDLVDTKIILKTVEERWGNWKMLAAHYLFEDLFWQRKTQSIPWLEELIRL